MLAKTKLDSIKALVSQALTDMEMKNLMRLLGREKYERMKENVSNVNKKQKNMRLNSVQSRKITTL